MFWRRRKQASAEDNARARREGWNACLDTIENYMSQHSWETEEDGGTEIFCDGCGASLPRELASMRLQGPARA